MEAIIRESTLDDMAFVIRQRLMSTQSFKPSEMPAAIMQIEDGDVYRGQETEDMLMEGTIKGFYSNDSIASVKASAFVNNTKLTGVSLPNVTHIWNMSFSGCKNLHSLYLPKVSYVESNAFYNCDSLKEVYLPKAQRIGLYAFYDCTNLEKIYLPSVREIGQTSFWNCNNLTDIYVGMSEEECGGSEPLWKPTNATVHFNYKED